MSFEQDPYIAPDAAGALLLTIDMQNDFTLAGAPGEVAGTAAVVPNVARLCAGFRAAGRPIVHLVRFYGESGDDAELCRKRKIEQGWKVVRPGSPGAELVDELTDELTNARLDVPVLLDNQPQKIGEQEWVLYKPRWGAFYRTVLEPMLSRMRVNTVVVCGCNFPNCPRATVYEASERDLRVVLVSDAVSGLYDRGREELEAIGVWVAGTERCLEWLRGASV